MDINFAAANMQGYNNPKIEIINVFVDAESNITGVTYNDIVKILSRGVFPIISLHLDPSITYFLPLEAIDTGTITFTCRHIYINSGTSTNLVDTYGLVFTPSNPPVFIQEG